MRGLPTEMDVARSLNQGSRAEGPLTLSICDDSKISAFDKAFWKPGPDTSDINLAFALPWACRSDLFIAMLNPVDGRASRLTATFFDSRVHPELVRDALTKALKTPGSPWAEL